MRDRSDPPPDLQSIQDNLTEDEIALLHRGQAALAGSSSSRAASHASSQGLLRLDPSSLAALGRYFDQLMQGIEARISHLSEQSQLFTSAQFDRAGQLVEGADAEIERYHDILRQLDELELDFDRIKHIREIVGGYRARVEQLDREMDWAGGDGSSNGGGGGGGAKKDKKDKDRDGHKHHHHSSSSHRHGQSHRHGHKSR